MQSIEPKEKTLYVTKTKAALKEIIMERLDFFDARRIADRGDTILASFGTESNAKAIGTATGWLAGGLVGGLLGRAAGKALEDNQDPIREAVFTIKEITPIITELKVVVSAPAIYHNTETAMQETLDTLTEVLKSSEVPIPPEARPHSIASATNLPEDIARRLEKLTRLRDRGSIGEDEYQEQKIKLLGS